MTEPPRGEAGSGQARLLLILLSFAWGLTWAFNVIALAEVTPWTLRIVGYAVGTAFMFALVRLRGRSARLPFGPAWAHLVVSGLLSVAGFGIFSAFAQVSALTSRVVIVAYSMPVWSCLLAWPILGERPNLLSVIGLLLCVGGLTVLVYPLAADGVPLGLLLALGAAVSWAAGTVYLKWARLRGDVVAITAWQLLLSFVLVAVCIPFFEGTPHLWPLSLPAMGALAYQGVVGTGLAYFLWFSIVGRVSAATASLGSLCVPVVGILSSMAILGERPNAADAVGFTLIFAAAACVLFQPSGR